jgi:predicted kinase
LLIHGNEGAGKSTFSAQAPDPVFIQTEDGLGQIDVPKFPLAESFDLVVDNLNALLKAKIAPPLSPGLTHQLAEVPLF